MADKKTEDTILENMDEAELLARFDSINLFNSYSDAIEDEHNDDAVVTPTEFALVDEPFSFGAGSKDMPKEGEEKAEDDIELKPISLGLDEAMFDTSATDGLKITISDSEDKSDVKDADLPKAFDERDELVKDMATENFNDFLQEEKKICKANLEKMKVGRADWDKHVEKLKRSKYYQKCLEKWRKYYQDKKAEFIKEAEEMAEALDAEARDEALGLTPKTTTSKAKPAPAPKAKPAEAKSIMVDEPIIHEEKSEEVIPEIVTIAEPKEEKKAEDYPKIIDAIVEPTTKVVEEKREVSEEISDDDIIIEPAPEEEKFKISTSNIAIDPDLRKTVEQVVLSALYDSFDASRDSYSKELSALEATNSSGPFRTKYRELVEFRYELSKALVQSFTKMFDITENKTVKDPYKKTIKEVQGDLLRNKDSMDIQLVADSIMDKLYHLDTKTDKVTGVVADLVDYLTRRVQEELMKTGNLGFALYKKTCKEVLNNVIVNSNLASNIMEEYNTKPSNDPRVEYVAKLGELVNKLSADLKGGKISFELNELLDLKREKEDLENKGFKFDENESIALETELSNAIQIKRRMPALFKVEDEIKRDAEIKKSLMSLKVSKIALIDTLNKVKASCKIEKMSTEMYSKNVKTLVGADGKIDTKMTREKGLGPVTDYLVMKMLEIAASENACGRLESFDLQSKTADKITFDIIDLLNKERNVEFDFTVSLLERIIACEHDIRETVKAEPEKYSIVQKAMDRSRDLNEKLSKDPDYDKSIYKKDIEAVLNDFVRVSQIKQYGKSRKKNDINEFVK